MVSVTTHSNPKVSVTIPPPCIRISMRDTDGMGILLGDIVEKKFGVRSAGSTVRTEIRAGLTTFVSMAYIILLNPAILSQAGFPREGVLTATVLTAAVMSIAMGLFANVPFAMASGMGMNAFVATNLCLQRGLGWQTALGLCFLYGAVLFVIVLTPLRKVLIQSIPQNVRFAGAAGIGFFLASIGLKSVGLIPDPAASQGPINPFTPENLVFIAGLLVTAGLMVRKVRGALVIGIAITAVLWFCSAGIASVAGLRPPIRLPDRAFALPSFETAFALDIPGALRVDLVLPALLLLFTDLFDSLSTFMGISEGGRLKDENGDPKNIDRAVVVDATGSLLSSLAGTSPVTTFIESVTGVSDGGKTGLASAVTGLCFLPFLFAWPLLEVVPPTVTAPAFVLVGIFMMTPLASLNWRNVEESLPAFLTMTLMPLTGSISLGIMAGFLSFTAIKLIVGKRFEIRPVTWAIDAVSIILMAYF